MKEYNQEEKERDENLTKVAYNVSLNKLSYGIYPDMAKVAKGFLIVVGALVAVLIVLEIVPK